MVMQRLDDCCNKGRGGSWKCSGKEMSLQDSFIKKQSVWTCDNCKAYVIPFPCIYFSAMIVQHALALGIITADSCRIRTPALPGFKLFLGPEQVLEAAPAMWELKAWAERLSCMLPEAISLWPQRESSLGTSYEVILLHVQKISL